MYDCGQADKPPQGFHTGNNNYGSGSFIQRAARPPGPGVTRDDSVAGGRPRTLKWSRSSVESNHDASGISPKKNMARPGARWYSGRRQTRKRLTRRRARKRKGESESKEQGRWMGQRGRADAGAGHGLGRRGVGGQMERGRGRGKRVVRPGVRACARARVRASCLACVRDCEGAAARAFLHACAMARA